jgi:hypothetical protein
MYRFRKLDVSGLGPFGEGNVLRFRDGLTLICGGNGLGKTTIARALRGNSPDARLEHVGCLDPCVPDWLIYFEEALLPGGGDRYTALTDLLTTGVFSSVDWRLFEEAITLGLREMLEVKVLGTSKFSGVISSSQQIELKIEEDGCLSITDSITGQDLNWGFRAQGERMVLYLAINRAIRSQVSTELDVPFVVDANLSVLDMDLLSKVIEFIESMAGQIILLERCFDPDRLRLATYEIRPDAGSGKSMIVECQ